MLVRRWMVAAVVGPALLSACSSEPSARDVAPSPTGPAPSVGADHLARPVNAGTIYVTNAGSDTVTAIRPDESTRTIRVGDDPRGIAVAPNGTPNAGTVYVANNGSSNDHGDGVGKTVTAIDPRGRTRTIRVHTGPFRLAVAPAGGPNAGTVYLTYVTSETATEPAVVTMIKPDDSQADIPVGPGTHEVAVAPYGTSNAGTVFVTNNSDDQGNAGQGRSMLVIRPDGATRTVTVGQGPLMVTVAPAGTTMAGTAYTADMGPRFTGTSATAVAPDGSTTTLRTGAGPGVVVVAPPGLPTTSTLYVPNGGLGDGHTLTVVSPAGRARTLEVGQGPAWVAVAPAGVPNAGKAYVLMEPFDSDGYPITGTVIILSPDGTTRELPAGLFPYDAVVAPPGQPNAGNVYVTNFGNEGDRKGSVTVIAPDATTHDIVTGGRPNGIVMAGLP